MNIYRLLILYLLLFILTGCPSYPVCISAADTSFKHLSLKLSEGRECESSSTEVTMVSFILVDKKKNPILWMIKSSLEEPFPSKGKQISALLYGVTPKGFFGETAKQLHPGDLIRVEVQGAGNSGRLEFIVTK